MDFKQKWAAFKNGEGEQPKVNAKVNIKAVNGIITATLTKEITDRDGEIVSVKGIEFNAEAGVPMLDAHNMMGSVVDNVLGRVRNIKKGKKEGIAMLRGELDFAGTPRALIAKSLVEGGYVDSMSIGFAVNDFDPSTNTITKSELFEASLVSVPANPAAVIDKSAEQIAEELEKKLKLVDDIHPKIKEYRGLFLVDLADRLGIQKSGNELLDIKAVYDTILTTLEKLENLASSKSQTLEENPQKETKKPIKVYKLIPSQKKSI